MGDKEQKSDVWKYFELDSNGCITNKTKCIFCKKGIYKGENPTQPPT